MLLATLTVPWSPNPTTASAKASTIGAGTRGPPRRRVDGCRRATRTVGMRWHASAPCPFGGEWPAVTYVRRFSLRVRRSTVCPPSRHLGRVPGLLLAESRADRVMAGGDRERNVDLREDDQRVLVKRRVESLGLARSDSAIARSNRSVNGVPATPTNGSHSGTSGRLDSFCPATR